MNLYKINKTQLEEVKSDPFKLEKDIQNLVEEKPTPSFSIWRWLDRSFP